MFAKVIVNPAAGARATSRAWPKIKSILEGDGLPFDYQFTESAGHAAVLARKAAQDGYRILIAVGGDGTVSEIAHGLLSSGQAGTVALGIIGTGTGNDLIRSLGLSRDYNSACRLITSGYQKHAGRIEEWSTCIDAGWVEYTVGGERRTRYFVNGAGVGFDAEVADAASRVRWRLGHAAPFLMGLLRVLPLYRNKQVRLTIDGRIENRCVLSIVVSNGAYFGGGMKIAPTASLVDRKLDLVVIGDAGKLELLRVFPRVYLGTHTGHPKVRAEKVEDVAISSDERILLQADGEIVGEGPVSLRIVPQALRLVCKT